MYEANNFIYDKYVYFHKVFILIKKNPGNDYVTNFRKKTTSGTKNNGSKINFKSTEYECIVPNLWSHF
jgi:hypothetical protein